MNLTPPDLRGVAFPPLPLRVVLGNEGFRIFFSLTALFAAFWPLWGSGSGRWTCPLAAYLPGSGMRMR